MAPDECIVSYAEPLYPTLTSGFRSTGLEDDRGLSAWMRQHSLASRCDAARESERPRKRSGKSEMKGATGMATNDRWSV